MTMPYDEYVEKVIEGLRKTGMEYCLDFVYELDPKEARSILADAWMAGLKYNLVMIESEKRRRDVQQN